MKPAEGFTRLGETAAHLAIAPRTLRDWVRRGIVPCYHPTRRLLLFKLSEVETALLRFRTGRR